MASLKIAVIGAGSAQFSLGLVRDICLTEGLHGSLVTLMDIDQDRISMIHNLANRYAREMGVDIRFECTGDREAALKEAQFIVNVALAGGHEQMEAERVLLEKYGYYRGIGVHAPCRQLELMLEIAREVERVCPEAYLLQCSNPLVEGCTLMTRETGARVIGLCHGHFDYRAIAETLGLDLQYVTCEAVGFNHCIWMTHFRYMGEDAYPLLDEWIEYESEEYWRTWQPSCTEVQMSPASFHLYKFYGLMPIGDTCRASWPEAWWYHVDSAAKEEWWGPLGGFDGEEGWRLHLEELDKQIAQIRAMANSTRKKVTRILPPEKSIEQITNIIDAFSNDRQGIFQVNVPNNGAISGLPDDIVVEVPALIDGRGIRPLMVEPLPTRIMLGVIFPRWLYAERLITTHRTGDSRFLLQTYLSDHRTRTWKQAEEALNALMSMASNEGMLAHYKRDIHV